MAVVMGCGSASGYWTQFKGSLPRTNVMKNKNSKFRVSCVSSCSSSSAAAAAAAAAVGFDPYKTLRVNHDASESEVKKAFRNLALQYHPDVCKGNDSGIQFYQINEAYHIVMSNLRGETSSQETEMYENYDAGEDQGGMYNDQDQDWELWEEWMGWEGAGIRDYSSHINPYI